MEYVVWTKAGKRFAVESTLTTIEAQAVLAEKAGASAFEKSLAGKSLHRMTPKMTAWCHVLANWAIAPREEEAATDSFPLTMALLEKVRDDGFKKFPKMILKIEEQVVVMALSRKGTVNVTDGGPYRANKYFGAIQPGGSYREGAAITPDVRTLLHAIEENAADAVKRYSTGKCCFCRKELTTRESRTVGYGQTCAKNHALPWGHIDPDLAELPKQPLQSPYY